MLCVVMATSVSLIYIYVYIYRIYLYTYILIKDKQPTVGRFQDDTQSPPEGKVTGKNVPERTET